MVGVLDCNTVGFIGLGAMGAPMVKHLTTKLPGKVKIYIFDIVERITDEICAEYPNKVYKGSSPKDVAEKSVS